MDPAEDIRLIVAVATELEAGPLKALFPRPGQVAGGRVLWQGDFGPLSAGLVVTGLGMVNTAIALSALLEIHRPDAVILGGVGGGYPGSGVSVGDIAVATKEIYGELGLITPEGWSTADAMGIPLVTKDGQEYFNEFPVRPELIKRAANAASQAADSYEAEVVEGVFVTVSTVSGTRARGEELYERFRGVCENMEGAAAAHVCLALGVDFLELRGISNIVEDRDSSKWELMTASQRAAHAVINLVSDWRET